MNKKTKEILKSIIPPIILDVITDIVKPSPIQFGWFGTFSSWEEASQRCEGYDSEVIIEKVKSSLLKVKNGEAVYERDSVIFDKIEYSFPLLSGIMWIAAQNGGKLNILDFGGSLGSTYFQNYLFLQDLCEVKWSIVEQSKFVEIGNSEFKTDQLKFFMTIDDCIENQKSNILILSGVLQYLESPFTFVEEVLKKNFEYIIFDRTAFVDSKQHIITVQKVPPEIYPATYPCWFFNEKLLLETFNKQYDIKFEFNALDKSNIEKSYFKGFVLKRKIC